MKNRRKNAKKAKKATWGDKMNNALSWVSTKSRRLWDKLMGSAFDDEFPLALGLVLTGGAIIVGCLDPWLVIGILGVAIGSYKLYHIFKWH